VALTKRIHVNQHAIKANRKCEPGEEVAPLTVKTYKCNHKCFEVDIQGPSKLVYRPENPLSCGATVWVETTADVLVDGTEVT
jgi:hypothetical protein